MQDIAILLVGVGLVCGVLLIGDLISLAVMRILKKRNW